MYEKELSFAELVDAVRRNIIIVILLALLGAGIGYIATMYLPKRYKVDAVVNFQSSYFRNALVSELVSETHDPTELRSQKLSMIQYALGRSYLESLGKTVGLLPERQETADYALAYTLFKNRIEYYPLDASNIHLSFQDSNPERAYAVTGELVERIREILRLERVTRLSQAKDAIEQNIVLLGRAIEAEASREKQANFQELEKKIRVVERELESLLRVFTDAHPKVQRLQRERQTLNTELSTQFPETATADPSEPIPAFANVVSVEAVRDLHSRLLARLSNLSVAMELEREAGTSNYFSVAQEPLMPIGPVFPSVSKFTAFGLVLGLLLGLGIGFVREILRGTMLQPQSASLEVLDVPLLGEFPILPARVVKGVNSPILLEFARKRLLSWAGDPTSPRDLADGDHRIQ
jgi:uncharacterized protein involved in exopolysaccharide biosynthesis